ncbi:hypothetical protein SAMN05444487_10221 [Marininema mesophilum]|uniref:Uncharacterized protein n=1 Tax=Marininema mesophilum TaxID=1048340 RepID=A0A1H2RUT3_9BACL|nr:hypothetical protein [Marininema mesophilum]SDW23232.1 hypothetical protein SAMN05444487_10221 [Marininema mesophilum]
MGKKTSIIPPEKVTQPSNSLCETPLEQKWPRLTPFELAYTELEQDDMFSHLPVHKIPECLNGALAFGKIAATSYSYNGNLAYWMDRVIHTGVRVTFLRRKKDHDGWVRAQYRTKPAVIEIYRASLEQLESFFKKEGFNVKEEDLIALHLFHEWFHHLENTRLGRTDGRLPRVVKKKWGPIEIRERLTRLREIAAHSFTQEVMGLPWYPLWLDHLLLYTDKGWSKQQIRDHFQQVSRSCQELQPANTKSDSTEQE